MQEVIQGLAVQGSGTVHSNPYAYVEDVSKKTRQDYLHDLLIALSDQCFAANALREGCALERLARDLDTLFVDDDE